MRPLRQITGEAEFNEVFLTDVRIPDADRLGASGQGWEVAMATLMNERVAIGGGSAPREGGMIGVVPAPGGSARAAGGPRVHDRLLGQRLVRRSVAPAHRASARQQARCWAARPEGSAVKLCFARLTRSSAARAGAARGPDAQLGRWARRRRWTAAAMPATVTCGLEGNSIEGGTTRSCATSSAERVLGLPKD